MDTHYKYWYPMTPTYQESSSYLHESHLTLSTTVGCFTKTKNDFKLDLTMASHLCHWLLSPL